MRLLCTLSNKEAAQRFSTFLIHQGIENQFEVGTNTDWGSEQYGDLRFRVWIKDEEMVEDAKDWLRQFEENPNDPVFSESMVKPPQVEPKMAQPPPPPKKNENGPVGPITLFFLITCVVLFIAKSFSTPSQGNVPRDVPTAGVYASPVNQMLLYDYPQTFVILNKITAAYGADSLADPEALPPDGQVLYQQFENTPFWIGFYRLIIHGDLSYDLPMFEKIRQGEVWRLFTPALLHSDIFHILFNMLWLIVLGKQIEQRLRTFKYLLFTIFIAVVSNTAQYLVTGPNFLGYSGILCGMFTFVWIRQIKAPWEGYQLLRSTIILLSVFIGGMALLQVASFFTELYAGIAIAPPIANTAHLTGAFCGWILGRMRYFAWKPS